jgi:hypothetical protein
VKPVAQVFVQLHGLRRLALVGANLHQRANSRLA